MLSKHIENGYGPTLLKCATPNDIGIAGVVSIHAGDNHLLCTDESGKVRYEGWEGKMKMNSLITNIFLCY
jgi:hypothetical protein